MQSKSVELNTLKQLFGNLSDKNRRDFMNYLLESEKTVR